MKKLLIGASCALMIITAPVFGADRTQSDLAQIVDSARHNDAVAVEKLIQRSNPSPKNPYICRRSR